MTTDVLEQILLKQTQLLERLSGGNGAMQTKTPANFSNYTPLHGPGGIWNSAGLERDILVAAIRPRSLANILPRVGTVFTNPQFGTLTGYTAVTGAEPTYACEDAPSGYVKGCNITARFGMIRRDSRTIDLDDVNLRLHRGDFTDLVLRGQVLGLTNLAPSGMSQSDILNLVTASELTTVAVNLERVLVRQLWQGTTAVANEFPGLDVQITTGIVDADTGNACPALDSDVKDFAYDTIGGSGRSIVEYLSMLEFYLRYNAEGMGLTPVTWAVVMRPELWSELTANWPCLYNTNRCGDSLTGTGGTVFVDGRENVAERDAMRNGLYIDINGNRYPVVLDTGIFEHTNINNANVPAASYASSIYFVPLTIGGGFPVTYIEHLDYSLAQRDYATTMGHLPVWWTDGGQFSWALEFAKWCFKFSAKTEQRVVLRTPQLAGRIDHVLYTPLQHLRDADPDGPYYQNGGVSLRTSPTLNSVW